MNECKVCSKECTGNTCSGACRAKLSRQSRVLEHQDSAQIQRTRTVETGAHAHVDDKRTDAVAVVDVMCKANGEVIKPALQAARTNPDLINHGKPLSPHGLKKAGLKANHVPIPGDSDYSGVCEQVGGRWQVRAS